GGEERLGAAVGRAGPRLAGRDLPQAHQRGKEGRMNGVLAVTKRELKTFFASPIAYIVLGGFLLLAGWLYFSTLFLAGQASLRGFFSIAPVLFVFLVPAITMRSIAEERKSGTLELLLTMPLENWQLVAGKFVAALGMVCAG